MLFKASIVHGTLQRRRRGQRTEPWVLPTLGAGKVGEILKEDGHVQIKQEEGNQDSEVSLEYLKKGENPEDNRSRLHSA